MSDVTQVDWNHIAAVVTQHYEETGQWVPYEELMGISPPDCGGETPNDGEASPPATPVALDPADIFQFVEPIPIGTPIALDFIAVALLFLPTLLNVGFDFLAATPPLQETPVPAPGDEANVIIRLPCLGDFAWDWHA